MAAEDSRNCRLTATEGMVCEDEARPLGPTEAPGELDPEAQKPVEQTRDAAPVTGLDDNRDRAPEIADLEDQIRALDEAMEKLQDAMDAIVGTPDEVAHYKNLVARTMSEKSDAGELPNVLRRALDEAGAGASGTDFLRSLAGALGIAGEFRDPAINPNSKFAGIFNAPSSDGGVGYNPYLNGGKPVVPHQTYEEGGMPADTSGGLCVYNARASYNGDPNAMPDATFRKIFNGPKSKIDPNLITMLASVYTALKRCNPGKNVCMQIDDALRPLGYGCGKPGVSCNSNHSRGTAIDFTVKSIPYKEVRNTAWCAGGYKGEVGDESGYGYGHIHMGTTPQGAWSRPRKAAWNNFTCDQYNCDDPLLNVSAKE